MWLISPRYQPNTSLNAVRNHPEMFQITISIKGSSFHSNSAFPSENFGLVFRLRKWPHHLLQYLQRKHVAHASISHFSPFFQFRLPTL